MKNRTVGLMALFALALLAPVFASALGVDLNGLDWGAVGGLMLANAAPPIAEQIKMFEAKRVSAQNAAEAIIGKSVEESRTLDDVEAQEHANHVAEVASIDKHVELLRGHEKLMLAKGTQIIVPEAGGSAVELRAGTNATITVKGNLPPGIGWTRLSLAMAQARGNEMMAHEIAKARWSDTPQVANILKASIAMGGTRNLYTVEKAAVTTVSTTDTAVQQYTDLQNEFVELLRPKTIMGRMGSLNRVPFNSRIGRQLTGVSGSFVGEGAPKPVNKQTYDNISLPPLKVAVIVVLTEEAVRFSTIKAEMRARDDMVKGIATYIDKRFMDPAYSAVPNVSPASITNAATRVQASGTTLAAINTDVAAAMAMFAASDIDPATAVWVMSATTALRLMMKLNTYDEPAFPTLTMTGGTWFGIPVIVSNAMVATGSPSERQIALVTQEEVFLADDGGVTIDMSTEASVQMNDAPSAGAQSLVSLWQNNLVGIRAEQFINWVAARPSSLGIALIENTNY